MCGLPRGHTRVTFLIYISCPLDALASLCSVMYVRVWPWNNSPPVSAEGGKLLLTSEFDDFVPSHLVLVRVCNMKLPTLRMDFSVKILCILVACGYTLRENLIVYISVFCLTRGRQRADDSQPWDLPSYGQHPEWHGGLGEDDPQGHLGSFWRRSVNKQPLLLLAA